MKTLLDAQRLPQHLKAASGGGFVTDLLEPDTVAGNIMHKRKMSCTNSERGPEENAENKSTSLICDSSRTEMPGFIDNDKELDLDCTLMTLHVSKCLGMASLQYIFN
jgi:hypothetical protein